MERTPYPPLPIALQDNRAYKQFWIALRCSGADPSGFAETLSKHFCSARGSPSG